MSTIVGDVIFGGEKKLRECQQHRKGVGVGGGMGGWDAIIYIYIYIYILYVPPVSVHVYMSPNYSPGVSKMTCKSWAQARLDRPTGIWNTWAQAH
jgi:hypothetical protein